MFKCLNDEKGAILFAVIFFGMILSIVGMTVFKYMDSNVKQTGHLHLRREANYTAKAAIEAVLYGLRNKTDDSLDGIVNHKGENIGFEAVSEDEPIFFYVDDVEFNTNLKNDKMKRHVSEVYVTEEGMTRDGLRKRYKVVAKTRYV
ncbi:hypothetical protein AB834_04520 [PVC group bacterium (ex Bugula neritina AB1)]|nr:hypothetical protein AB834_04520 [PVC group bacterium (ex Bugula neritina AB1)]